MNDRDDEKLQRLIEGVCSQLPTRRAPAELERRVLDELTRRAALPWWRRGFTQWPVAARAGLLVVCVSLAALSLTGGLAQRFDFQTLQTLFAARPVVGLITVMGNAATLVVSLIPPLWIYLTLSVGTVLYLLLFGLGAFAYRTLYLHHSNTAIRL